VPDNIERVGVFAEVASAAAAIVYPLCKVVCRCVERQRLRTVLKHAAAAAAVERRLTERCSALEARVVQLETLLRNAA
jgi:hypothetical protein